MSGKKKTSKFQHGMWSHLAENVSGQSIKIKEAGLWDRGSMLPGCDIRHWFGGECPFFLCFDGEMF